MHCGVRDTARATQGRRYLVTTHKLSKFINNGMTSAYHAMFRVLDDASSRSQEVKEELEKFSEMALEGIEDITLSESSEISRALIERTRECLYNGEASEEAIVLAAAEFCRRIIPTIVDDLADVSASLKDEKPGEIAREALWLFERLVDVLSRYSPDEHILPITRTARAICEQKRGSGDGPDAETFESAVSIARIMMLDFLGYANDWIAKADVFFGKGKTLGQVKKEGEMARKVLDSTSKWNGGSK